MSFFLSDRTITVRPRTTPISADVAITAVTYMSIEEHDDEEDEDDNKIVEARNRDPQPSLSSSSSYTVVGYDSSNVVTPMTKPLTINAGICTTASPRELPAFRDAFDSKREVTSMPVGNAVSSIGSASMTADQQQQSAVSTQGRSPTSPLLSSCSLTP
jgi:hypothetical protein